MLLRLIRLVIGLVFIGHGLVHLTMYPGADAADGGRLFWNGTARFGADLPAAERVGHALVVIVVVLHVVAGSAIIVRKLLTPAGYLIAATSALSLALFWWMWPGLEPVPGDYWRGPVFSAAFLILSPIVGLSGRDAATVGRSRFARSYFATWGTTAEERAEPYPCDARMRDATCSLWRGIDVDASTATV